MKMNKRFSNDLTGKLLAAGIILLAGGGPSYIFAGNEISQGRTVERMGAAPREESSARLPFNATGGETGSVRTPSSRSDPTAAYTEILGSRLSNFNQQNAHSPIQEASIFFGNFIPGGLTLHENSDKSLTVTAGSKASTYAPGGGIAPNTPVLDISFSKTAAGKTMVTYTIPPGAPSLAGLEALSMATGEPLNQLDGIPKNQDGSLTLTLPLKL